MPFDIFSELTLYFEIWFICCGRYRDSWPAKIRWKKNDARLWMTACWRCTPWRNWCLSLTRNARWPRCCKPPTGRSGPRSPGLALMMRVRRVWFLPVKWCVTRSMWPTFWPVRWCSAIAAHGASSTGKRISGVPCFRLSIRGMTNYRAACYAKLPPGIGVAVDISFWRLMKNSFRCRSWKISWWYWSKN